MLYTLNMMFFKDYQTLNKRVLDVETELTKLKQRVDNHDIDVSDMRSKVLQKIQRKKEIEQPEQPAPIRKAGQPIRG